jgi:hypothetical protein
MEKRNEASTQWDTFKDAMIVSPGAFSYSNSETTQIARATVGLGTIIVRDNPYMDLSGLNRDTSQALTEELVRNDVFQIEPLFGYVDQVLNAPKILDAGFEFAQDPKKYFNDGWQRIYEGVKNQGQ